MYRKPVTYPLGIMGEVAGASEGAQTFGPVRHRILTASDLLEIGNTSDTDGSNAGGRIPSVGDSTPEYSVKQTIVGAVDSTPLRNSWDGDQSNLTHSPRPLWGYTYPPDWNGLDEPVVYQPNAWPRYLVGRIKFSPYSGINPDLFKPWGTLTGTGVLVGPRHVLTASHVVPTLNWYDFNPYPVNDFVREFVSHADKQLGATTFVPGYFRDWKYPGKFASQVYPVPSSSGSTLWLGKSVKVKEVIALLSISVDVSKSLPGWAKFQDVAVLILDEPIGHQLGWCAVAGNLPFSQPLVLKSAWTSTSTQYEWDPKNQYQLFGYPAMLDGVPVADFDTHIQEFYHKTYKGMGGYGQFKMEVTTKGYPGMSGGPLWRWNSTMPWPTVQGVMSGVYSKYVGGTLTKQMVAWARAKYK
ncbi:MAG: hypothetical protein AMXMBFR64_61750 [Myxococcales bacterium]